MPRSRDFAQVDVFSSTPSETRSLSCSTHPSWTIRHCAGCPLDEPAGTTFVLPPTTPGGGHPGAWDCHDTDKLAREVTLAWQAPDRWWVIGYTDGEVATVPPGMILRLTDQEVEQW